MLDIKGGSMLTIKGGYAYRYKGSRGYASCKGREGGWLKLD